MSRVGIEVYRNGGNPLEGNTIMDCDIVRQYNLNYVGVVVHTMVMT